MSARLLATIIVAIAIVATIVGFVVEPTRALDAYLVAILFWVTLAVGALLVAMVGFASRAVWFVVVRRVAERVFIAMPALAVLFIPVLIGMKDIYPWARGMAGPDEELPAHLRGYLSEPYFVVRTILYFLVLVLVAELLVAYSRRQDTTDPLVYKRRMLVLGASGIPFVFLVLTFASFDWLMSLEPKWVSTMFGVYVFAGAFVSGLAVVTLLTYFAVREGPLAGKVQPTHFHALGRLMLAFTIFWGYTAYAQFFLIWIADMPDEVTYFKIRLEMPWIVTSVALAAGQFLVPFFILLVRSWKFRPRFMAVVGAWIVFWHYIDVYWLVVPAHYHDGAGQHWLDLAAVVAVGGIVAAVSTFRQRKAPPVPVGDPELALSVRYQSS